MNTEICVKIFASLLLVVMLVAVFIPKEVLGASTTGITLDKSSVTLGEFNTETLFAKLSPDNAKKELIEWSNSNQKAVALERRIVNGTYYIKSALNTNKTIDIKSSSTADSAKIQLWNKNNTKAQRFEIKCYRDNYYTITAKCSNKALASNGKTKGSVVKQQTEDQSDAIQWEFEYAGNGYYYIKSKNNGLYLDVKNGKTANGTQIQVWTENRSNSQKYKLELVEKSLEMGTYYIKSALNENKVIDIKGSSKENKAKVQLWNKNNSVAQQFKIMPVTNGSNDVCYTITALCSNKNLDVTGAKKAKGTTVQQYASANTNAQRWYFESAGNGYYYIKSKCNGLYLDVKNGKTDNGTQMQVWTSNKSKSQKFKLELVETVLHEVEEGTYKIRTALDTSKVVSVANNSTEKGAKIIVANNSSAIAQQFEFTSNGNGYYFIRNKNTGKVLDVTGGNATRGTKIQQWTINGSDAQLWKVESIENGYYYIKSKSTGLYLDVTDGKATSGIQLQIESAKKSNAQKFKLEKINNDAQYNNYEYVTLKPKQAGTAIITATLSNGKTANCTVTVLPKNDVTNILFIGDSQTYYNKMPEKIFAPMAEKNGKKVHVETITATDKTLNWHYENREKRGVIREETTLAKTVKSKRWDYVVLQEEAKTSYSDYNTMKTGVTNIVNYIRKNGSPNAQIIYNAVWMDISSLTAEQRSAESGRPEITQEGGKIYELQRKANNNYYQLAKSGAMKGKIAFSGKAFIFSWRNKSTTDIQIYRSSLQDWKNPAVRGSYMEAICIYYAIFGEENTKGYTDFLLDKVWNYVPGETNSEHTIKTQTQINLWANASNAQSYGLDTYVDLYSL